MRAIGSRPDRRPLPGPPSAAAAARRTEAARPWRRLRLADRGREIGWLTLAAACLAVVIVTVLLHLAAPGPLWIGLAGLAVLFLALAWRESQRALARDRTLIAAEAEQLLLRQRTFLQDASHQLRTPITIALGHAELLAAALAGRQQRDIDVVVGELERLKALSEQLLLVAASENAEFLELAPVDLAAVAADLVLRWQPVADRRWRLADTGPARVLADRDRIAMALDALMDNAIRHTGPGDEITVSVCGADSDGCARIAVTDTGAGIAEDDLPHIFDRFTSIGGNRSTGLGLALVRAIAHGHRGQVTVRSTQGAGSSFELRIPVQREPGITPGAEPAGGTDRGQQRAARPRIEIRRREARCE